MSSPKKVCIIGSAPTKADAPYWNKEYDIWAISGAAFSESLDGVRKPDREDNTWNCVTHVDMIFEMHKRELFLEKLDRLAALKVPVMMQKKETDIPMSEAYPADDVASKVGEDFASTISYMIALAIYRGYKEIRLYGVILLHDTEYVRQRPSVKYYLGIACGRGIKVWAPEDTRLTVPGWRYGYDDHDMVCYRIDQRRKEIIADMEKMKNAIDEERRKYYQLMGASLYCAEAIAEIKGGLA